jgi:hypothetical protein
MAPTRRISARSVPSRPHDGAAIETSRRECALKPAFVRSEIRDRCGGCDALAALEQSMSTRRVSSAIAAAIRDGSDEPQHCNEDEQRPDRVVVKHDVIAAFSAARSSASFAEASRVWVAVGRRGGRNRAARAGCAGRPDRRCPTSPSPGAAWATRSVMARNIVPATVPCRAQVNALRNAQPPVQRVAGARSIGPVRPSFYSSQHH